MSPESITPFRRKVFECFDNTSWCDRVDILVGTGVHENSFGSHLAPMVDCGWIKLKWGISRHGNDHIAGAWLTASGRAKWNAEKQKELPASTRRQYDATLMPCVQGFAICFHGSKYYHHKFDNNCEAAKRGTPNQ